MSLSTTQEILVARTLAQMVHHGQVDKAGIPYIDHVARVAAGVPYDIAPAAWLHDVVEDTPMTLEQLEAGGFGRATLDVVDALTRRPGEHYRDYIERVARCPAARVVKEVDLRDNLDPRRIEAALAAGHDTRSMTSLAQRYNDALLVLLAPQVVVA